MAVLTIGMACYRSYESVYFTCLSLRVLHGWSFELVVIDNAPESCQRTKAIVHSCGGRYYHRPDLNGTTRPRNACFQYANTPWVMVIDDHVILDNGAVAAAIDYADRNPLSKDIISGPILGDDGRWVATHWQSDLPHNLWGVWGCTGDFQDRWGKQNESTWNRASARAAVDRMEPFEIPSMGLGLWMMRKAAWPEFNPHFRKFGGEEGYIHEKVRRLGGKAICHPKIRWHHKFRDPSKPGEIPYPLDLENHVRNLLLGGQELGIDHIEDVWEHYGKRLNGGRRSFDSIVANVKSIQPFGQLYARKRLNILGVWYTNNAAPEHVLRSSLMTVRQARSESFHDVVIGTSSWAPIADNTFPNAIASQATKRKPGHATIINQIREAWEVGQKSRKNWTPDVICFLEHDVLYPPGYFDRVGDMFLLKPSAEVVNHTDYIGLNQTGWLRIANMDTPLHQLSMRPKKALDNLVRAEVDCDRQGWAYLEPDHGADRSAWAVYPIDGFSPSVHINW